MEIITTLLVPEDMYCVVYLILVEYVRELCVKIEYSVNVIPNIRILLLAAYQLIVFNILDIGFN